MAWGARLAEKLDAELNGTVYSGKGFYFNIWRPDDETIGVIFPRAESDRSHRACTTCRGSSPDAVVVAIGGNDYNIGLPEDFGPRAARRRHREGARAHGDAARTRTRTRTSS